MQAIQDNPKSGAFGTISAFIIGMIPQVDPSIQTTVIFWLLIGSFVFSMIEGSGSDATFNFQSNCGCVYDRVLDNHFVSEWPWND